MSNIASNCQRSASLEVDIVTHDLSKMLSNISHNSIGTIKRNGRPATNVAAAPGHNHPPSKKSPQALPCLPMHPAHRLIALRFCWAKTITGSLQNTETLMRFHRLLIFVTTTWLIGCGIQPDQETLRTTHYGPVIGTTDSDVQIWRGIPFAAAPVEQLRWRSPQAPLPWEAPLEALEFASSCFQGQWLGTSDGNGEFTGAEDCLYLNIFAPPLDDALLAEQKVPVMVWIHGGANTIGSASTYEPYHLVRDQNVIVVTLQYRLSSFGWFRHPALRDGPTTLSDDSGNFGTLDTIAALRFVRDNIGSFGGDPDNITIFGESAGAHNVAALIASPIADGLFQKAIMQSGIVTVSDLEAAESDYPENGVSGTLSSQEILYRLLEANSLARDRLEASTLAATMSAQEIADFLRAQTPAAILTAERAARAKQQGMTRVYPDGYVVRADGIAGALQDPERTAIPILVGSNRDESKLFNAMNPQLVEWGNPDGLWAVIDRMPLAIKKPDYYQAMSEYGSNLWKLRAVDDVARGLTDSGHSEVFVYRFDWDDLPVIADLDYQALIGAAHAIELLFLFPEALENPIIERFIIGDYAEEALKLSAQMRDYWGGFAHTGQPGRGLSNTQPAWAPWSERPSAESFMILDGQSDQGLTMSNAALTTESLLAALESDARFDLMGRCKALYSLTYRGGDELTDDAWETFADGQCLDRDYTATAQSMEWDGG